MEIILELPRDINKLCRTCMGLIEDNTTNFIIFENRPTELCKMLQSITPLKVTVGDGLPSNVCDNCVYQLKTANSFIHQCTEVEDNLKKILIDGGYSSKEFTDTNSSLNTLSLNQFGNILTCKSCETTYPSYYELSMHMITHNTTKTLVERVRDNYDDDKKIFVNSYNESFAECKALIEECRNNLQITPKMDMENSNRNGKVNVSFTKSILKKPKLEIVDGNPVDTDGKIQRQCETCNLHFKTEQQLSLHILKCYKNSGNNRKLVCTLCEKKFQDYSSLSLHFLNHSLAVEIMNSNIISEFFCEFCGQTFDSDLLLSLHYVEAHTHKPNWDCAECLEVFDKEKDLLIHNVLVHLDEDINESDNTKEIQCVLCSERFPSKAEIHKHSLTHLMKRYTCRKCSISFCTQDSYYTHLQVHSGRKHVCSLCGKFLSTNSALKSHIEGVHSVELQHCCSICGKRFATFTRLKTHSKIHTTDKKYICSYCGYSSHKSGDLVMHTRIHTRERPYKCTFPNCTTSFKTSSHLCHHLRRHFKIKNFKCNVCPMKFSTNHGLKIHQMLHTGERPHSCIVCKKSFRRKYHLKVHMKQHNDVVVIKK